MVSNMLLSKRLVKATTKAKVLLNKLKPSEIEMNSLEVSEHSPGSEEERKTGSKKKKISESMEQAQILKGELDRVLSGVKLLGDTVDRLNQIVRSDNGCCSGAFDMLLGNIIGQSLWERQNAEQGGYTSVRLDDSSHG